MTPQQINLRVKASKAIDYLSKARLTLSSKDEDIRIKIENITGELFNKYLSKNLN